MNDDNGIDWRFISTRSRILIVVGIVLFVATEATFAVGRYQIEEPSFHPYTSKYDY
jgi:hypothetical protein